jgi:bacteriorhodopsin
MGKISKWLIALYAISILGSGIMSTSPFETGIAFSLQEAQFHSAFATIAGFALSFAMLASILETSQPKHKSIHLIALVLTLLLSITFGFAENGAIAVGRGVVQRGLYLVGFAWLVLYEQLSHPHDTRPSPSHT